jgi:hypothetical protein
MRQALYMSPPVANLEIKIMPPVTLRIARGCDVGFARGLGVRPATAKQRGYHDRPEHRI